MKDKITIQDIISAKGQRKLTMITAYDFNTSYYLDQSGVDMILVGDSLAMVVLGHEDTLSIGMKEMLHHTRAVTRAAKRALVIGDMPFMSYQAGIKEAVHNAGLFLKKGRAHAVKLEGGQKVIAQIKAIVDAGIPVQGHLGLTPQSVRQLGGFRVQGRDKNQAEELIQDAKALEQAGCFSIVLEAIPTELAKQITSSVSIPTIGIGAGPHCDGQVLVIHDLLGLNEAFKPKFVKHYAQLGKTIREAITRFRKEVENGEFPDAEHSYF